MTDHIQELISSYLHGGTTPEQERELFETCARHPETAELLRRHLLLSLKIRGLREQTDVPAELRNTLLLRLNELQAARMRNTPATIPVERKPRFGWGHVLSSAMASAAIAVLVFLLLPSRPDTPSVVTVTDTVRVVERDTVLQIHEINRPVYITRASVDDGRLQHNPIEESAADVSIAEQPIEDETQPRTSPPANETYVEALPLREIERRAKVNQYLEQYNSMLASVETVRLTRNDRITQ
jgi:hypothetical protein